MDAKIKTDNPNISFEISFTGVFITETFKYPLRKCVKGIICAYTECSSGIAQRGYIKPLKIKAGVLINNAASVAKN